MDCEHCSRKVIAEDTGIPYESVGKILYEKLQVAGDGFAYIDVKTGKSLTFKQVLEKSTKLAIYLKKRGLKRNDVVAVITENSPYFVVPYLSCLYNGYIVNPIDTQFKIGEMKHCMDLTKPRVIFASKTVLEMLKKINAPYVDDIFVLDSEAADGFQSLEDILAQVEEDVKDFEPENLDEANQIGAYLYSSGTTGLPKAVILSHRNLRHLLMIFRFIKLKPNETTILAVSSTHIYGLMLITGYLYNSATLVGFDKFKLDLYLKAIQKYGVSKLFLVPAIIAFLLKGSNVQTYMLESVEQIFCGSAILSQEMIEELERRFEVNLIQLYGLTETSGASTMNFEGKVGSVGKTFGGIRLKVVGAMGEELPPNAIGEIAIKGESVSWGYTQREKNTFDYQGYLLTGDLGYVDDDGFVYVSGRNKDMFKCKGFQVGPAEVESVILQHPAVAEVAVIGVKHEIYGEVAAAFLRLLPGSSVSSEEIMNFVADRLSSVKHLHGGAIFVDEFPRTASGKVLRLKLKDIYYANIKDV